MDDDMAFRASSSFARLRAVVRRPFQRALIAALLLFALTMFLPGRWISAISWQLYLDRLNPLFAQPVGCNGRLILGSGAALAGMIISLFIAMLALMRVATPTPMALADGRKADSFAADTADPSAVSSAISDEKQFAGENAVDEPRAAPLRGRRDHHPDDALRAPIRAGRELPEGGLGPVAVSSSAVASRPDPDQNTADEAGVVLADLAAESAAQSGAEPWFQAAPQSGAAKPDPSDISLSALVLRLEASLLRQRSAPIAQTPSVPVPETPPITVAEHKIDLALEAALGTLRRMN